MSTTDHTVTELLEGVSDALVCIATLESVAAALDIMQESKRQACHTAEDTNDPATIWQANGEYCGVVDAKLFIRELIAKFESGAL